MSLGHVLASFCRRYQVRSDMPSAIQGLVADRVDASVPSRGRPCLCLRGPGATPACGPTALSRWAFVSAFLPKARVIGAGLLSPPPRNSLVSVGQIRSQCRPPHDLHLGASIDSDMTDYWQSVNAAYQSRRLDPLQARRLLAVMRHRIEHQPTGRTHQARHVHAAECHAIPENACSLARICRP